MASVYLKFCKMLSQKCFFFFGGPLKLSPSIIVDTSWDSQREASFKIITHFKWN